MTVIARYEQGSVVIIYCRQDLFVLDMIENCESTLLVGVAATIPD